MEPDPSRDHGPTARHGTRLAAAAGYPSLPRLRIPSGLPRAFASAAAALSIAILRSSRALLLGDDSAEAQFLASVEQLQIEPATAFADEAMTPDETENLPRLALRPSPVRPEGPGKTGPLETACVRCKGGADRKDGNGQVDGT